MNLKKGHTPKAQPDSFGSGNIRLDLLVQAQEQKSHVERKSEEQQVAPVKVKKKKEVKQKKSLQEEAVLAPSPFSIRKLPTFTLTSFLSWNREKSFALTVIAGLFLFTELCSMATIPLLDGQMFSVRRFHDLRAIITEAKSNPSTVHASAEEEGSADTAPEFLEEERMHPFLGYVSEAVGGGLVTQSGEGEFEHVVMEPSDNRIVIGIFGGSVAQHFTNNAVESMKEVLSSHSFFHGKEMVIVPVAMGGYKQPQQLIAFNYLLSLGAHFDIVINIDGFNEVALAGENVPQHVSPYFPRAWSARAKGIPDAQFLSLMGEEAYVQSERVEWAQWFDGFLVRYSPTANLIWMMGERGYQHDVHELQSTMLSMQSESGAVLSTSVFESDEELVKSLSEHWERSSEQMNALAKAEGIRYFHFLQPNQYVRGSKTLTRQEQIEAYNGESPYKKWVEIGYPYLRAAGSRLLAGGESFHDLTMLFRGTTSTVYKDNCCHFNKDGNIVLGRTVGQAIIREW